MIYVKGNPLINEIMDTKQYLRLERVSENGIIVCSGGNGGTRAHHCFPGALHGECHMELF